jgi:hypothetical protein
MVHVMSSAFAENGKERTGHIQRDNHALLPFAIHSPSTITAEFETFGRCAQPPAKGNFLGIAE